MDTENQRSQNRSSNPDEEHADTKDQLQVQTLAKLAEKATARVKVIPELTINTTIKSAAKAKAKTTSTPLENVATSTATMSILELSLPTTIHQTITAQLGMGMDSIDKPLSQKSDDSDCTLQSDQSESNALKAFSDAQSAENKSFAGEQTLDRILLAHSEQAITTARVEVDCNASRTTRELMLQAGSAEGDMKSCLTAVRDATMTESEAAAADGGDDAVGVSGSGERAPETTPTGSVRSIGSFVCRICHNSENPERLVSPCLCKGSLTYVHIHCLERWISTSRSTVCELCQFQYNTVQTLRYSCLQSLRMWYSRSMSRRALQEDCQMFSLLTLVAFGIIGTLLVGIQYYILQGQAWGLSRMWTKGWLIFFLFTTLAIYFVNIYMILKSQLSPWYRWWQASRDIKLILENRKPFHFRSNRRLQNHQLAQELADMAQQQQQQQQQQNANSTSPSAPVAPQATPTSTPQPPYQPMQPTTAALSMPLHITNKQTPLANAYHLPLSINSIELQGSECHNFDVDVATWPCRSKIPLAKASSSGVMAVAMYSYCNQFTSAATIEIPLEGRLYEFETAL